MRRHQAACAGRSKSALKVRISTVKSKSSRKSSRSSKPAMVVAPEKQELPPATYVKSLPPKAKTTLVQPPEMAAGSAYVNEAEIQRSTFATLMQGPFEDKGRMKKILTSAPYQFLQSEAHIVVETVHATVRGFGQGRPQSTSGGQSFVAIQLEVAQNMIQAKLREWGITKSSEASAFPTFS